MQSTLARSPVLRLCLGSSMHSVRRPSASSSIVQESSEPTTRCDRGRGGHAMWEFLVRVIARRGARRARAERSGE
eukprot:5371798-Prymnesium_polylepis.1